VVVGGRTSTVPFTEPQRSRRRGSLSFRFLASCTSNAVASDASDDGIAYACASEIQAVELQVAVNPIGFFPKTEMAAEKADLPDLPHPGGAHHHHKAFFDRHTYQHDAYPVRISNAQAPVRRFAALTLLAFTLRQRPHARPPASTGSRNRRGPGSSPGGVPVLAQVGVQPGRRALGRSLHAQTRRSLTRACRSLARSLVRYPGSSGSSPPPFAGRFSTIPGRTERIATPRL